MFSPLLFFAIYASVCIKVECAAAIQGQHARRNAVLISQLLGAKQSGIEVADAESVVQELTYSFADHNGKTELCWVEGGSDEGKLESKLRLNKTMEQIWLKLSTLSGRCVDHTSGWTNNGTWYSVRKAFCRWTYSVCLNEEIKQSHTEAGVLRTVWSLGKFKPELLESKYPVAVVQHYEDGQPCDETEYARKSVVYVGCCNDAKLKIKSLQETEICSYTVFVCSSVVCELGFHERLERHDPYLGLDLLKAKCFKYKGQWWTYEVCVGQTIRQYHLEDDKSGQGFAEEFSLGNFEATWQSNPRIHALADKKSKKPLYIDSTSYNRGLLQYYSRGSPCEIEALERQTWVRFACDENAEEPRIEAVQEIATCIYEIHIKTHYVCGHAVYDVPKSKTLICS